MKNIYIIYADAGGGHRSLMETFSSILLEKEDNRYVEGLDIYELLRKNPALPYVPKQSMNTYNYCPARFLKHYLYIWTFVGMIIKRFLRKRMVKGLKEVWKEMKPDLVISVYPFFNDVLYQSLEGTGSKFLTFIADYGEFYKKLWILPQSQHYICNVDSMYQKLLKLGIHPNHVLKTSGFLLPKNFYEPHYEKKELYRQALGLDVTLFTIIIAFGAYGSSETVSIFKSLSKIKTPLQLIFMTGRGRKIPSILQGPTHHKVVTIPFSPDIDKLLASSDLFIGKPGPGLVSQAISQQLPVIVKDNSTTMYQERFVADWVKQNQYGLSIKDFSQTDRVVSQIFEKDTFKKIKERLQEHKNQAYFEISHFLNKLLA